MNTPTYRINAKNKTSIKVICFLFICFLSGFVFGQRAQENANQPQNKSNEQLINQYIQSIGSPIITFDASNIKQFWVEHSVLSKDHSIEILLKETGAHPYESIPLKIQLANVTVTQDCTISIIAETPDCSFSVLDTKLKTISVSSSQDNFLHYSVLSANVHLNETTGFSFNIQFNSNINETVIIKRIVLSFSDNKLDYLSSPGILRLSGNDVVGGEIKDIKVNSFLASGKRFSIFSKKKILVSDREVKNSIKIKNIGNKSTDIYFGYAPYTGYGERIHNTNNPYKNINKVMEVVSFTTNSNKITVNSYPEWEKGCHLVLNAKDDLSDFPNSSFIDGTIVDVKEIDNEHTEITFDKPIKIQIEPKTKVRVQSKLGNTYLYTNIKRLEPGEEVSFSSTMKKDETFFQYSPEAFSKGTSYVVPLILSFSVDPNDENTILISDFSVSF